jgi:hypothetical protein
MSASLAGFRREGSQVAGDEHLGVAVAASHHLQWSFVAHDSNASSIYRSRNISLAKPQGTVAARGKITLPVSVFTPEVKGEKWR